jgi:hypothetical protein
MWIIQTKNSPENVHIDVRENEGILALLNVSVQCHKITGVDTRF